LGGQRWESKASGKVLAKRDAGGVMHPPVSRLAKEKTENQIWFTKLKWDVK